jgi:hypothetical protein
MWWAAAAWAAAPDREVAVIGSAVESVSVSDEGRLVVGVGGGRVVGLSTLDWEVGEWAGCDARSAAVTLGTGAEADALVVSVGCADGTVARLTYDEASHAFSDVDAFELPGQNGPVAGMFAAPGLDRVFAVTDPTTGLAQLYVIENGAVPTTSVEFGFNYSAGVMASVGGADTLFLTINQGTIVPVTIAGAVQSGPLNTLMLDPVDIAASPGGIYGLTANGIFSASLTQPWSNVLLGYIESPGAVVGSPSETDAWFLYSNGTDAQVFGSNPPTGEAEATFTLSAALRDLVAVPDGYVFGAGGSGVAVLTANPWVVGLESTVTSGTAGTVVPLSFGCDADVRWELVVGGDRSGYGGTVVDSGQAEVGEVVEVTTTIDGGWDEGDNLVFVRVTDSAGRDGYDAVHVSVDNPPSTVDFSDADVSFADGGLTVTIPGVDDADVDHYLVYITTTPFVPEDFATGGPAYEGPDAGVVSPLEVYEGVAPGVDVGVSIDGLTNGETYYLAVRVVDAGGAVGAMSDVAVGMPEMTFSSVELSGEEGGTMGCSTTGGAFGLIATLAAAALVRRHRIWPVAGLLASGAAYAGDGPQRDDSKSYGSFELRYGALQFDDHLADGTSCADLSTPTGTCALRAVYGTGGANVLTVGFGGDLLAMLQGDPDKRYRPTSVLQADVQLGFLQKLAYTTSATGESSGERTMITTWPLGAGLKVRAHIWDEQIFVPYLRAGADVVPWSEKWDNASGGKDVLRGTKYGANLAVGGQILLDGLARSRASLLEAQTGVNDTYLTVEYRRNDTCVPWKCGATAGQDAEGLAFSGSQLTFGLALGF